MRFPQRVDPDKNYRITPALTKWCVESYLFQRQAQKMRTLFVDGAFEQAAAWNCRNADIVYKGALPVGADIHGDVIGMCIGVREFAALLFDLGFSR